MFDALALGALSGYIRHSPIETGKWRLASRSIRWVRAIGPRMGTRTIWTRHGHRMELDLADWVDQHIYATGEYEPDVLAIAKRLLRPGMTAVDIGANIGFFSLLFAALVGPSGKVISLEPQPRAYERLARNLALNPALGVDVRKVAACDSTGELEFYCGRTDHSGVASLRPIAGTIERITVPTATGDSLLADCERIDLIKIDVEGAETRVIRGLSDMLRRWQPDLIVEVSNRFLQEMGSSGGELCGMLGDHGYQMFQITWNGFTPLAGWNDGLPDQFNAIFTRRPEVLCESYT